MRSRDSHALEETYRRMTDGELLQLAADVDSLTDAARTALEAELRIRNLAPAPEANALAAALPEESTAIRTGPRRAAGVNVAGILLLVLSVGLLATLVSTLFVMPGVRFSQQWLGLEPSRFRKLINYESQIILAGWGIATGLGILWLRSWARISGVLICNLCAYAGFGAVVAGLGLLPAAVQQYRTDVVISSMGIVVIYFGAGGLGVVGTIFLSSESTRQEFLGPAQLATNSRSDAVTCIAIWLIVAWPVMLSLALVKLRLPLLLLPDIPFVWLLFGWKRAAYQCVAAGVAVVLGVGLLRVRPWARIGVLGLCVPVLLSALVFPLEPYATTAEGAVVKGMSFSRLGITALSLWDAAPALVAAWLLLRRRSLEFGLSG